MLPAAYLSHLDCADNEVHGLRRLGSVLCLQRKGQSAPMCGWGFLRSLASRHRLPPHPWPRHRTIRFEAPHENHSIVYVQIDQHRSNYDTMQKISYIMARPTMPPTQLVLCFVSKTRPVALRTKLSLGDVRGPEAPSGRGSQKGTRDPPPQKKKGGFRRIPSGATPGPPNVDT